MIPPPPSHIIAFFEIHETEMGVGRSMMDGLADVAARIAETRDPNFHKKEEDDGPPFKCHCKCSLLGGCECWCGDKDEKSKAGNRNRRRHH